MLIIFQSGEGSPPEYIDLHIRDSESGEHIPVAGVEDRDGDYVQTVMVQYAPLEFQEAGLNLTGGTITKAFWARRLSKIVVRMLLENSNSQGTIRLIREDSNGARTISEAKTVNAIIEENGKYLAEEAIFNTYGANRVRIYIESLTNSAGVDVYVAGV